MSLLKDLDVNRFRSWRKRRENERFDVRCSEKCCFFRETSELVLYLAEILYEVYETPPTGDEAEDRPIAPVPKVPLIAVFS